MLSEFQKRFMKIVSWVPLILIILLSPPVFAEEVLRLGGTGSALGSMQEVAKAFEKANQGIKVMLILPSLGTSGGIKAVSKGAIDLGLSSRPLKEEEAKLGSKAILFSRSPLVFVTRLDVAVTGLSTKEIIKIYRAETLTWRDGKRIRPIMRPKTETDFLLVKQISPEVSQALDIALSKEGLPMAMTDQDCLEMLEKTPGGFAVSTMGQIISEKRPLKILAFNGVTPSIKTIADGSYPLFRELYLLTKTEPSGPVRKFIDFAGSSPGRKIMEEAGNLVLMGQIKG